MKDNVAAVVVWYNPESDYARMNIESYISSVGVVCVVDNSDKPLSSDLKTYVADNPMPLMSGFARLKKWVFPGF